MVPTTDLEFVPDAVDPGATEPSRWGAIVTVELPPNVSRHPRLTSHLQRGLGRRCGVDVWYEEGVRVGFDLQGESREQADTDCRAMTEQLIGCLGVSERLVRRVRIYGVQDHLPPDSSSSSPDLHIVRNER